MIAQQKYANKGCRTYSQRRDYPGRSSGIVVALNTLWIIATFQKTKPAEAPEAIPSGAAIDGAAPLTGIDGKH